MLQALLEKPPTAKKKLTLVPFTPAGGALLVGA